MSYLFLLQLWSIILHNILVLWSYLAQYIFSHIHNSLHNLLRISDIPRVHDGKRAFWKGCYGADRGGRDFGRGQLNFPGHNISVAIMPKCILDFSRNGINNTRNFHRWSHYNPHGTVETNIERRFSISLWCGMFDERLISTVILDCHVEGIN